MSRQVQLSPESDELIQEVIDRGDFENPAAVIDDALQALVEREKLRRLRALIAIGDEQLASGQIVPWIEDFFEQMKQRSAENVRQGQPFKDEVIP